MCFVHLLHQLKLRTKFGADGWDIVADTLRPLHFCARTRWTTIQPEKCVGPAVRNFGRRPLIGRLRASPLAASGDEMGAGISTSWTEC